MKFVLLFSLLLVGCFSAPDGRSVINDRIRGLIDDIRNDMEAPLFIERRDIELESESIVAVGHVEDVRVDGHNEFIDEVIQFSLVGLRLTFRIRVPLISFAGLYDLDGRIMNRFPVRGNGNFRGEVHEIVVDGHCRLAVSDGFLYMREFVPRVTIGGVVSEFEGLISDQALTNDFINRLIEVLIVELFDLHEDAISQAVADIAIPIANSVLNNMTIADLLTTVPMLDERPTLY